MLRRNIDTKFGLVNGAIGTVLAISSSRVKVKFNHLDQPYDVERVRCKFMMMKKFFIYMQQFPLMLAYAITIHKSQGLSLDGTIVDLSSNVCIWNGICGTVHAEVPLGSAPGVLPSGLRQGEPRQSRGVRAAYRPDLPPYKIPKKRSSCAKRKMSGSLDQSGAPETKRRHKSKQQNGGAKKNARASGRSERKGNASRCEANGNKEKGSPKPEKSSGVDGAKQGGKRSRKRKSDEPPDQSEPEKKRRNSRSSTSAVHRSPYKFFPIDLEWQQTTCQLMGMQFQGHNGVHPGSNDLPLGEPQRLYATVPDRSCLFMCFSYLITGTESNHHQLHLAILNYMRAISGHAAGQAHHRYSSIDDYIQAKNMDSPSTLGTDVEIASPDGPAGSLRLHLHRVHRAVVQVQSPHGGQVPGRRREAWHVHQARLWALQCGPLH